MEVHDRQAGSSSLVSGFRYLGRTSIQQVFTNQGAPCWSPQTEEAYPANTDKHVELSGSTKLVLVSTQSNAFSSVQGRVGGQEEGPVWQPRVCQWLRTCCCAHQRAVAAEAAGSDRPRHLQSGRRPRGEVFLWASGLNGIMDLCLGSLASWSHPQRDV